MKLKAREAREMPIIGGSVDRRTLEHLYNAYNDETIHSYFCFLCSERHVHVESRDQHEDTRYKGTIEYHTVKRLVAWLEPQEGDTSDTKWTENFDFDTFVQRYMPWATEAESEVKPTQGSSNSTRNPEHGFVRTSWEWKRRIVHGKRNKVALCCPEDIRRSKRCNHDEHTLCGACQIPLCFE